MTSPSLSFAPTLSLPRLPFSIRFAHGEGMVLTSLVDDGLTEHAGVAEHTGAEHAGAGQQAAPESGAASRSPSPDERATSFRPVEGGQETRSGEVLLVEAYAVLWLILLGWIALLWRKQGSVHARLDALEKELDKAADKAGR